MKIIRLLPLAALFAAGPAFAENAFTIKTGNFNLTHDQQDIDGANGRNIEESADNVYGFAWEHRRFDGTAYGAEFIRFDNDWASPGASGTATSHVLLFTAKRYVQTATIVFPYLGMGAGLVHAQVDGLDFDPGLGVALQLAGGVEFRWQAMGIYTEIKGLYAETGLLGDELNSSGVGAFVGATLRF